MIFMIFHIVFETHPKILKHSYPLKKLKESFLEKKEQQVECRHQLFLDHQNLDWLEYVLL